MASLATIKLGTAARPMEKQQPYQKKKEMVEICRGERTNLFMLELIPDACPLADSISHAHHTDTHSDTPKNYIQKFNHTHIILQGRNTAQLNSHCHKIYIQQIDSFIRIQFPCTRIGHTRTTLKNRATAAQRKTIYTARTLCTGGRIHPQASGTN